MTKEDQKRIATEIINCFSIDLLKIIEDIPEEWNGFEIRQLAVDYMNENYTAHNNHDFRDKRKLRRSLYESYRINHIRL